MIAIASDHGGYALQKNVPETKRELTNSSPCDKVINNFYRGDPEDDKTR